MSAPVIPFLDLRAAHDPIRAELLQAIGEVIDRSSFAGGPYVAKFESEFATFCGSGHCVASGNGTDALWLPLAALGVGPGDEVITVAHTFIASAEAISRCGAKPVFVDIDETTYTMDPAQLEAALTPRTKAILPVHLYGQMADMDPILELAGRHGIPVVEDACQAHGATYKGRKAGTLGVAGAFSFYPGKNLGALGEAGATTTNDPALARRMATLRDHGQRAKYRHSVVGWNARMDGVQAAALSVKLGRLAAGNQARRDRARLYGDLLAHTPGVATPQTAVYGNPVFHLYVVRVAARDALLQALAARGIQCGIHYPQPVHLQEAYAFLGYRPGSLPVTERVAREVLSLPLFPELTPGQVAEVTRQLRAVLAPAPAPAAIG